MVAQAAKKTELKDVSKEGKEAPAKEKAKAAATTAKAKEAEEPAADEEGEEGDGEARARATYFVASNPRELGTKRDAMKYLKETGLKDGEVLVKGRTVELRKVEVYELA